MTHQLDIPVGGVRELVFMRAFGLCGRCGGPMRFDDFEAHHRRRRNVLGWCPCNIVALHARCHTAGELAVHDNVEQARRMGLIVPTFGPEPYDVPVILHAERAHGRSETERVLLSCDGLMTHELPTVCEECGDDDALSGFRFCSDCLERRAPQR